MAATPEFVDKNPDTVVAYLKAWLDVAKDFKNNPDKVADTIYSFYTSKGYKMSQGHLRQGAGARRGQSRLAGRPRALHDSTTPKCCWTRNKIKAMPDWSKALPQGFPEEGHGVSA